MSLSLRNAMKLGKFCECEIVAGEKGLNRIIENITIMEVPEVVQWLKGKELILTSLFAIKDDSDAQNLLVRNLHNAGATALAIKPSQFIKSIPDGILDSANKLGFPIIKIPDDVKYLDILSPVMNHIFNDKVVLQEDLEQATQVLHEISMNAQGVDGFVENVGYLTKNMITIESEFSYILVPSPEGYISPLRKEQVYELSVIQRPIQYERKYEDEIVSCIVAPIIVDGQYYGNITSWGVNNDHLSIDLAILEKASSLLSLEFLRLKVKYDIEQQYKSDFMRELLFSETIKEKNLIEWGDKYLITKDTGYVCLLFSVRDSHSEAKNYVELKDYQINSVLQDLKDDMLVGHIRNGICIIFPVQEESGNMEELYSEIYNALSKYVGSSVKLSLGIGRIGKGPEGIQKSFLQAEQALHLSETVKNSQQIVYYNDLGAYRLINQLNGNRELLDFYDETIGKIVKQDINNQLLTTLQTYFFHDEILKITASSLYIHVNTLKYRINKIETITGCDLKTSEGKMNLYLGLKIHNILNLGEI
ncbi:PucR family transcriptional regulator [Virgibacillus sp. JSM 102003]|uniref:PucR family transcriptional regulator n=1 Tax=Virgibacillus sp. JSM 102003 TaxID=1562108 RepID=UPI0035BEFD5E